MQDYLKFQIGTALVKDGVCKLPYASIIEALTPAYFPEHYRFGGVAHPGTTPGKIFGPTMFVAVDVGVYNGFSNHSVGMNEVALFTSSDGGVWDKWVVVSVCCDDINYPVEPTPPTPGPDLKQPLTFEALNDNTTINFYYGGDPGDEKTIEVSTDGGQTWTEKTASAEGTALATLGAGEKLLVRGNNAAYSDRFQNFFHATGDAYVYGNIMSLISSEGFDEVDEVGASAFFSLFSDQNETLTGEWLLSKNDSPLLLPATTLAEYCYSCMFKGCTGLTEAPALPATTLAEGCYDGMFSGCTGLTAAPELPATTLAAYCYNFMFSDCTGLTAAPELPATTLAGSCYLGMFDGCTGLTAAPELPATTLAVGCYEHMFSNCTSLTAAPELPATTLATSCYQDMFSGCANLSEVKCYAEDISAMDCVNNWLDGVAATGTFYRSANNNDWDIDNPSGIPQGWTVIPPIDSPQ